MSDTKAKVQDKATVTEVVFNLISTLILIGSDADLTAMFTEQGKYSPDFKQHITFARGGLFKKSAEKFVKGMFTNVILKRKEYVEAYQLIQEKEQAKVDKKLPKWYGKQQLLADVEAQGNKMTEAQRMMLKVNDLKNIFAKLKRKGINNCLGDGNMTDKECRDVIASITQMENKLKDIL